MTRKSKRVIVALSLLFVLTLATLLGVSWSLVSSAPAYWTTIDRESPQVRRRAAEVESFVSTQTTEVRTDMEQWSMELTAEQVNAWLAARFPAWLLNQGVEPKVIEFIPAVLVDVADGKVEFAAELKLNGDTQIVRFVYEPVTGEAGHQPVRLNLAGVYAGKLPLPVDWTIDQIKQKLSTRGKTQADTLRQALESVDLVLSLEDGRLVKVVGMTLEEGKALLTCQTDFRRTATAKR